MLLIARRCSKDSHFEGFEYSWMKQVMFRHVQDQSRVVLMHRDGVEGKYPPPSCSMPAAETWAETNPSGRSIVACNAREEPEGVAQVETWIVAQGCDLHAFRTSAVGEFVIYIYIYIYYSLPEAIMEVEHFRPWIPFPLWGRGQLP